MSRSHGAFLSFEPPSGERVLCSVKPGRFFLPATAPMGTLVVSKSSESGIAINIDATTQNATITADHDHCTILGNNKFRYVLPASSSSHTYSVVLREFDNILAPTGRWGLVWDDESGSIHNSMRPPPLPTPSIPSDALEPLHDDEEPTVENTISESPSPPSTDNDSAIADVATPQEVTDENVEEDQEVAEAQLIDNALCPSTPLPGAWPAVNTINSATAEEITPTPDSSTGIPATKLPAKVVGKSDHPKTAHEEGEDAIESLSDARKASCVVTEKATEEPKQSPETSYVSTNELMEKDKEKTPPQSSDPVEKTPLDAEAAGDLPLEFTPSSLNVTKGKGKRWNIIPTQKATSSSHPSRKRSIDASSEGSGTKRVRFSQSPNADASETEEGDGNNAEEEMIVAPQRRSPPAVSTSKSTKTRGKSSSTSPSNKTIRQSIKENDWTPKIYMAGNTKIDQGHKKIMRSFNELGGSLTKNIIEADVLCVGKDEPLVKSGSLLLAIARGIPIVTEDWLIEATRRSAFPYTARYLPKDPERERLWGFKLADAVAKGRRGLTHLLANKEVYLTKSLLDSITSKVALELSKLAVALGADGVKNFCPSKKTLKDTDDLRKFIIIGAEGAGELHSLAAKGLTVYSKDLLTMAVLRGKLERKAFTIASAVKHESD